MTMTLDRREDAGEQGPRPEGDYRWDRSAADGYYDAEVLGEAEKRSSGGNDCLVVTVGLAPDPVRQPQGQAKIDVWLAFTSGAIWKFDRYLAATDPDLLAAIRAGEAVLEPGDRNGQRLRVAVKNETWTVESGGDGRISPKVTDFFPLATATAPQPAAPSQTMAEALGVSDDDCPF